MTLGPPTVATLKLFKQRPDQTAIGAERCRFAVTTIWSLATVPI
jgi:hypothetical protein